MILDKIILDNKSKEAIAKLNFKVVPGQALLVLIEHANLNNDDMNELKKLYLLGSNISVKPSYNLKLIKEIKKKGFKLQSNFYNINEDPVRRFFETQLAYEILKTVIKKIDINDLRKHLKNLVKIFPESFKIIEMLDQGVSPLRAITPEYIDLIKEIKETYGEFDNEEKEKMLLLAKSFAICLGVRDFIKLPLDIYGKEEFSKTDRGKIKKNQEEMKNVLPFQLGLIKSYMPVPYDPVFFKSSPSKFVRPADNYRF